MTIEPARDAAQRGLLQIRFEQAPEARDMAEILRLAVAPPQAGENTDDLGVALRREDRRRAAEGAAVDAGEGGKVAFGHRLAYCARNVAARVFEQRDEVVARRPAQRVLEVEQPDTAHALPARQKHQI